MKTIGKIFVTGLFTVLPVLATGYLVVWSFVGAELLIGAQLRQLIPAQYYFAGLGLTVFVVVVFLVGLLMRAWLFREIVARSEHLLLEIPLVRSIYAGLRDLLGLFAQPGDAAQMQVVSVELPTTGMRLLGFVTRSDLSDLPAGIGRDGDVAVYLPMSYMVGGYTVFVPRTAITAVAMSREEAMKFVVIAAIRSSAEQQRSKGRL